MIRARWVLDLSVLPWLLKKPRGTWRHSKVFCTQWKQPGRQWLEFIVSLPACFRAMGFLEARNWPDPLALPSFWLKRQILALGFSCTLSVRFQCLLLCLTLFPFRRLTV